MTCRVREFYLSEIDAWEAGYKGSPGCPSTSERYALRMREARKRLTKELRSHESEHGCERDS